MQGTVEIPEVHILGRSSSSLEDQALFSACHNECLKLLDEPLSLSNVIQVKDVLHFFHGDGPTQQFEAGNSIGGTYCCMLKMIGLVTLHMHSGAQNLTFSNDKISYCRV